ncbi:CHAT domain-containing protein [Tolypothrix sp. VBCCA 56010]|uniref:CHAT domain-containing protein n=1 Tax=Tolypothrix sp. VBCCA 56010 TaxID=3137731 RepID=UPI003D7EF91D
MKKKILILSANPVNISKLRLDEEVREIQSALERSRSRQEFQLITKGAVRINDLRRALLDEEPQIVHFSGHGVGTENASLNNNQEQTYQREAVRVHSQPSGIVLEDDFGQVQLVSTKALTELFKLFKDKIECILLNACYSETQASAIYQYIDCVIGMERAIPDNTAIKFSVGFYDAIGAGRTYAEAFKFGCNNINLNNILGDLIPAIKSRNISKTLFSINSKEQKAKMSGDNNDNKRIQGGYIQGNFSGTYNNSGNYIEGNYNNTTEKQNLAESAAEIQKLLEQLDKTYSTDTFSGKVQIANETIKLIENNHTLAERILSALKTGSVAAFEQFLSHPAASFVIGALEDWQKTKAN